MIVNSDFSPFPCYCSCSSFWGEMLYFGWLNAWVSLLSCWVWVCMGFGTLSFPFPSPFESKIRFFPQGYCSFRDFANVGKCLWISVASIDFDFFPTCIWVVYVKNTHFRYDFFMGMIVRVLECQPLFYWNFHSYEVVLVSYGLWLTILIVEPLWIVWDHFVVKMTNWVLWFGVKCNCLRKNGIGLEVWNLTLPESYDQGKGGE